jgi:uncharacterized protein involved in exopolysaccharide biosynthesis
MNQNKDFDTNSFEIDFHELIHTLWMSRKQILSTALIFMVLGGVLGFSTPATYTAGSTFLPQITQSGGGETLGGLAALAGINLNTSPVGGDIPPVMYERVLASEPFKKRLLDAKIWVDGDTISYRDYLNIGSSSGFDLVGTIKEYTIGLPGKILGGMAEEKEKGILIAAGDLQVLSDNEYTLHKEIAGKISIETDKKEGVVSITVVEGDPMIAAQVAKVTEEVLQAWIIEHKNKNAKSQYDFIVKQFEAKQKDFFSIQEQLAGYMERNQNVLSASNLIRLERLQAEFDLVNTVYSELAKQKEQAAIQLSKDTPTFSVLDPVRVPKGKTGPNKKSYVLGAFFMGLIFSVAWSLARKYVPKFLKGMQVEF